MDSTSSNRGAKSGLRDRRYAIRHPFAADGEILDLKSGARLTCVTSDLSLGGCFVCARQTLDVGTRVRYTLKHQAKTLTGVAIVRVSKPRTGMGLEFLDVDWDSMKILVAWLESGHESS
jgi:PilZ domain